MNYDDELRLYRGKDFKINEHITIHIPTLGEICDYGDVSYFSLVRSITSTPSDLKWQLAQMGVDFTMITEFELFSQILSRSLTPTQTSIILGNIDLSNFSVMTNTKNDELVMYDEVNDILIDEYTYILITDCLRQVHNLKKNTEIPANESTKLVLIEDARDEFLANMDKQTHSSLLNLVSAMINSEGFKYNHTQVWDMKINAFMDSVLRISKIKNAELLLTSGYSGFGINLKDINEKQTNWLGEL